MAKIKSTKVHFIDTSKTATPEISCDHHSHLPLAQFKPGDFMLGCLQVEMGESALTTRIKSLGLFKAKPETRRKHKLGVVGGGKMEEPNDGASNKDDQEDLIEADGAKKPTVLQVRLEGYGKTHWKATGVAEQSAALLHNKDVFLFQIADFSIPAGKHGYIRYRIRVKRGSTTLTKKLFLTGLRDVELDDDLLTIEDELTGQSHSLLSTFSGSNESPHSIAGCIPVGERAITAEIERRIYHHEGDVLRLTSVVLKNDSAFSAKPFVKLVQRQTYYGRGLIAATLRRSFVAWLLSPTADLSPLVPHESRIWTQVGCTLPSVPASFAADIIQVEYFIEVSLDDSVSLAQNPLVSLGILMTNSRKLLRCLNCSASTLNLVGRLPNPIAGNVVSVGNRTFPDAKPPMWSSMDSSIPSFISDLQSLNSLPAIAEVDHESWYVDRTSALAAALVEENADSDDQVFESFGPQPVRSRVRISLGSDNE